MKSSHPFITHIDHIGIHAADPKALFHFFTQVLHLPVAFPYSEYPNYYSGSVTLGNCFLELMRFGAVGQGAASGTARYHILGFLTEALPTAVSELTRRNVPHSGIVPFFAPEATDDDPIQLWANVYLGQLFGHTLWTRLFLAITKQGTPKPSLTRSPWVSAISIFLMARAFRSGMPVLTAYYRHNDDAKRAADWEALRQVQGGPLGIEKVQQVIVGMPQAQATWDAWQRTLAPLTPGDDGVYRLEPGPAIRLTPAERPGIQNLVLQVRDLAQAETFLRQEGVAVETAAGQLTFFLPHTGRLPVQLAQSPRSP